MLTDRARKLTEALRQSIKGIDEENEGVLAQLARRRRVRLASALAAVSGALLLAASYLLIGQIIIGRNAAQRQKAEEALRASQDRFETLCEQAPVGIYSTDAQGLAVYTNSRWSQMSGMSAAESLGHGWKKALHPDDRESVFESWKTHALEGTSWKYRLLTPEGEIRWMRALGGPIYSPLGEITGYVGTVEDITEVRNAQLARHEAEEGLRESEERFRATFYQAAVGIAQTSIDGHWQLLNDRFCEILGYSRDELREKTFLEVTHPDDREASFTAASKLLAGEISSWASEKRYIRKDGVTVWARLFASLVREQHNQPQYFISVVEDITEKIRAERALQHSRQELRALTARLINAEEEERKRISRELHDDLGQELALLAFNTDTLVHTLPPSVEGIKEHLRKLKSQIVQLSEQVRQIAHQLHPQILEDLGLNAALSELCEHFSTSTGCVVTYEQKNLTETIPIGIASCLYRIAQEALHNVSKHACASQVRLTLKGDPKGVSLCIHDNGAGFDLKARSWQHGIGIVSMKERVRMVQGEFSIHSEPGGGTTVSVFVPLAAALKTH